MNVLRLLKNFGNKPITLEQLSKSNKFPVLSSEELIFALSQESRLRSIYKLASVSSEAYDELYDPAIRSFIEACQLQPASATHHHAGLGGLVYHTLEVVEFTLKQRKQLLLPPNSEPETISKEEHVWTYAVFAAALLHDAGKLLTLTRLKLDNDKSWTPAGPKLHEMQCNHYQIEFVQSPYNIQTRVSTLLFDILPPKARDMLVQNNAIFKQLTAYLSGDTAEMGVIGKIVGAADRSSTGINIREDQTQTRLTNAPTDSIGDLLVKTLRQVVNDGEIKINRSGGAGWFDGHFLYIASRTIADLTGNKLRADGHTTVPNNLGIFDKLQDAGLAIRNSGGLSVHTIKITSTKDKFEHKLTVLKFEADRVIAPQTEVKPFEGTIIEIGTTDDNGTAETEDVPVENIPTEPNSVCTEEITKPETANENAESKDEPSRKEKRERNQNNNQKKNKQKKQSGESKNSNSNTIDDTNYALSLFATDGSETTLEHKEEQGTLDVSTDQKPATEHTPEPTGSDDTAAIEAQAPHSDVAVVRPKPALESDNFSDSMNTHDVIEHEPGPVKTAAESKHDLEMARIAGALNAAGKGQAKQGKRKIYAEACKLEDDDIGRFFMSWLLDGIKTGYLTINNEDSKVHVLEDGIGIVTPLIFKKFCVEQKLVKNETKEVLDGGAIRVQERLRKLRVLLLSSGGRSVHKLSVANSDKPLSVFVIKRKFVFPGDDAVIPKPNPSLKQVPVHYL